MTSIARAPDQVAHSIDDPRDARQGCEPRGNAVRDECLQFEIAFESRGLDRWSAQQFDQQAIDLFIIAVMIDNGESFFGTHRQAKRSPSLLQHFEDLLRSGDRLWIRVNAVIVKSIGREFR